MQVQLVFPAENTHFSRHPSNDDAKSLLPELQQRSFYPSMFEPQFELPFPKRNWFGSKFNFVNLVLTSQLWLCYTLTSCR